VRRRTRSRSPGRVRGSSRPSTKRRDGTFHPGRGEQHGRQIRRPPRPPQTSLATSAPARRPKPATAACWKRPRRDGGGGRARRDRPAQPADRDAVRLQPRTSSSASRSPTSSRRLRRADHRRRPAIDGRRPGPGHRHRDRARRAAQDGTEFPIEIMLSPLESAEGIWSPRPSADITARKRWRRHCFKATARTGPSPIHCRISSGPAGPTGPCDFLSPQMGRVYRNPRVRRQLGYRWLEQLHPDDRDRVIAEWTAAPRAAGQLRHRIPHPAGGRRVPLVSRPGPSPCDNNGQVVSGLVATRTLTTRSAQRRSSPRPKPATAACWKRPPTRWWWWTGAARSSCSTCRPRRSRYSRDELVGQAGHNIIPEGFAERIIADDLRSTPTPWPRSSAPGSSSSRLRKDGTESRSRSCSARSRAPRDPGHAAIRDITAARRWRRRSAAQ